MKRTFVPLVVGSVFVLSACSGVGSPDTAVPVSFPSPTFADATQSGDTSIERVVQQVLPAVVNVVGDQGEGTGFIVREDGIIVTNYHVVEQTSSITVYTSDENPAQYSARVIGGDQQADLAVLDIDANGLPTIPLGDSDQLNLGQRVVAIGYALGLEGGPSVTAGIVSSLTRQITVSDPACRENCTNGQRTYADVIQTDAAINPGNSGGPLVDLAGNVVGINTAGTTSAENVGFAIQINSVKPTIFQAADHPNEPVAFLGVGTDDASNPAVQFQLTPPVDEGAVVLDVVENGPAAQAGIRVGDVIVGFDGQRIATSEGLGEAIHSHKPGDRVEVDIVHEGGEHVTVTVQLGVNPVPTG